MPDGPSRRQVQVRIENYFNRPTHTHIDQRKVGRPTKPPDESKGDPKPTRYFPRDEAAIKMAIRAEWDSYQEFSETVTVKVGTIYTKEQIEKLEKYHGQIAPLLDVMP